MAVARGRASKQNQWPEGERQRWPQPAWPRMIRQIPRLRDLPAATLDTLGRELEFRIIAPRQVLFFENEITYDVYIVLSGLATMTYLDARARRVLLEVLGPGDLVGDLPFMPEPLRGRLRCDALHECAMGKIDCRRLVEILFGMPFERLAHASAFLFGAWPERLARAALVRGWPLRERLLGTISYVARRFGVQDETGSIVNLPLTHADLADLVGASRPKVSHHMRLLEKQGLLVHERHRIILPSSAKPATGHSGGAPSRS
ncbi:MAG TPA: Crp/Fnr family transcriptional regulator [Candidatus Binataceae bacterium]|nr:Crp/Fnr family transcriptional regulator [Candidatus Binataceae bacterium]